MKALSPGDGIDNFTLTAELHQGAMAQIYRVRERLSGRDYALKIPFEHIFETPLIYYHFQNEERIAADLIHPHIVRFYTRNRSRPYSVLEYVDGRDLRRHLDAVGPLSLETVQRLGQQICAALDYLHSRQIAHLDLKPENLMLTARGNIRLIDFGLARHLDEGDPLASDFDMPRGTPAYAPPEVLADEAVGAHSDQYSLGLVLYEMLTGHLPFERSKKLRTVKQRLSRPPIPPRRYRPDLTPQWQELLLTALEREPENRYARVADLQLALEQPEKLAVTARGRVTGRLRGGRIFSTWPRPRRKATSPPPQRSVATAGGEPHILGAIVDDERSDAVIERVKQEALTTRGRVTLLTVVEPRADDQFTQYENASRGVRFKKRLDRYVDRLRQYAIDPTVRICRGEAVAEILRVAAELPAQKLILGVGRRRGLKKMLTGRVSERLNRRAGCAVVVADSPPAAPAPGLPAAGTSPTRDDLAQIDLFLVDTYVAHLGWMADWIRDLLAAAGKPSRLAEAPCELGRWLDTLNTQADWQRLGAQIAVPHQAFHATAAKLAEAAARKEMAAMRRIYLEEILPLSCAIRDGLRAISARLHERSASDGRAPLLEESDCPVAPEHLPPAGPLAILREIHAYLCQYPEGSPENCLLGLGREVD